MSTFSPRDIKNRKFKQSLMGFDAEEVKGFLKIVSAEFEKILAQNAQAEKRLTEQTVKSTLGNRKEAEKAAEKDKKAQEDADKTAEGIIARAKEEVEEIRHKAEREAHEKARRETSVMLSQAKVMADEILLSAKQKAEEIAAAAKAASAPRAVCDFERPLSLTGEATGEAAGDSTETEDWDMKHAEEAQRSFDRLIGEAMSKAESIIQNARTEAEVITSSLIGRTLGELNKEHERLLAAVQNAVHKSEQIVKAARAEAEQFAVQRKCDAVEQCNAVLLEAERKAGAIFSNLRSQAATRKARSRDDRTPAPGSRRTSQRFQ